MPKRPHARAAGRHRIAESLRADPPARWEVAHPALRAALGPEPGPDDEAGAAAPEAPPAEPPAEEEGSASRRRDAARWMSALP